MRIRNKLGKDSYRDVDIVQNAFFACLGKGKIGGEVDSSNKLVRITSHRRKGQYEELEEKNKMMKYKFL